MNEQAKSERIPASQQQEGRELQREKAKRKRRSRHKNQRSNQPLHHKLRKLFSLFREVQSNSFLDEYNFKLL